MHCLVTPHERGEGGVATFTLRLVTARVRPGLLVRVNHPQVALCLGDRSLHRFDQVIHFLGR
jgi:hypothetical protein